MLRIRSLLIASAVVFVLAGMAVRANIDEAGIDEQMLLEQIAPGESFTEKSGMPPYYASGSGMIAFNSYDIVPELNGYAGPIKTLVVLDSKGVISGLAIVSHRETENFVRRMLDRSYLSGYIGKTVNDPFVVDRDIDGISRATVSVEALAETVRASSVRMAEGVLGMEVAEREGSRHAGISYSWAVLLLMFALATGMQGYLKGYSSVNRLRSVFLLASVIVVGIWLAAPFSGLHVFNILLKRISSDPLWIVIVVATFISLALSGRVYCGWLCPLGALLELLWKLSPYRAGPLRFNDMRIRHAKYAVLVILGSVALLSGRTDLGNIEPYVTLFSFHGSVTGWFVLVLAVIIPGLIVNRFWCRYLCPAGAIMAPCSSRRKGYPGSDLCPMGNMPGQVFEGGTSPSHAAECIRCNYCAEKALYRQ